MQARLALYRIALGRLLPPVFLGVLPAVILGWALVLLFRDDNLAVDFHHELYPQTKLVLDGADPYPPPDADLSDGTNFVWPIAASALVAPLALLPAQAADVAMTVIVIACLAAALLVLGVRDWRIFGVVALWPPFINAMQTANLTLPLCLLAALVWRYRDRAGVAGAALGLGLALKFFLWPLVVWLAALRRYRDAALAGALAAASLLLILPFDGLGEYVRLLHNLSETFDGVSYTLYALLVDLGLPDESARGATLAAGAGLLVLAWRRRSFTLAIAAALALSPIVWMHFFALLALPLALAGRRLTAAWFLPLAMWLAPGTHNGETWQTGLVLAVAATTLALCELRRDERARLDIRSVAVRAPTA